MKTSPTASMELCPKMLEQSWIQQLVALVPGFSGSHECHRVMKSSAGGVGDTVLVLPLCHRFAARGFAAQPVSKQGRGNAISWLTRHCSLLSIIFNHTEGMQVPAAVASTCSLPNVPLVCSPQSSESPGPSGVSAFLAFITPKMFIKPL